MHILHILHIVIASPKTYNIIGLSFMLVFVFVFACKGRDFFLQNVMSHIKTRLQIRVAVGRLTAPSDAVDVLE